MTDSASFDLALRDEVLTELELDPAVDPAGIGVTVHAGVVSLLGTVASVPLRTAAERAAYRVQGVHGVANDLRVRLPSQPARTDAGIAEAALAALARVPQLAPGQLQVTVADGCLTLHGTVPSQIQREAAEQAVHPLAGVTMVVNAITLTPTVRAEDIRRTIEETLVRRARTDAQQIRVELDHQRVILTGAVRTRAEKRDAERAAWATPGVAAVDNRLAIVPAAGVEADG